MSYSIGNESFSRGVHTTSFSSNISRTATTAAYLFTLPAKPVIKSVTIIGAKADTNGIATLSLGSNGGTGKELLADFNVKTNGEVSYPSSFAVTPASAWDTNPIQVVGTFAENGGGSSAGGPWTVIVEVLGTQ